MNDEPKVKTPLDAMEELKQKHNSREAMLRNLKNNYELLWKFKDDNFARMEVIDTSYVPEKKILEERFENFPFAKKLSDVNIFLMQWKHKSLFFKYCSDLPSVYSFFVQEGNIENSVKSFNNFKSVVASSRWAVIDLVYDARALRSINEDTYKYLEDATIEEITNQLVKGAGLYAMKKYGTNKLIDAMDKFDDDLNSRYGKRKYLINPVEFNEIWKLGKK